MTEELQRLIEWLRNEARKRTEEAMSRRDGSESMQNSTPAELRASKAFAERMAGHKLEIDASKKSAVAYADMQDRIAAKLDAEARQLEAWASMLSGNGRGQ